jgi:hypothetical protein|tara:strand:+ start:435 stop:755 length:321 start_codon:yes stop_codon:yes gene_type:complete
MKKIIVLLALIFSTSLFSQEYVLLEINSEWNWSNKAKIDKIRNIPHQIAYLENQTPKFRKKIRSVPLVILYKNGKPIMQWSADISFKLVIKKEEVLKAIAREEKKQ